MKDKKIIEEDIHTLDSKSSIVFYIVVIAAIVGTSLLIWGSTL